MNRRPKLITTSAAVAAVALAGAIGVTAAANADDEPPTETIKPATTDDEGDGDDSADDRDDGAEENDVPITGPDLERAKEAALAHLGEGKVTGTEIEDEESYYEVEVRLPDGRQVDVQLNESFNVVYVDGD